MCDQIIWIFRFWPGCGKCKNEWKIWKIIENIGWIFINIWYPGSSTVRTQQHVLYLLDSVQLLLYILVHPFEFFMTFIVWFNTDALLTWDVGFVELVQHQQVELVGVGVAHHAGHGHDGGHRLTEGSLSRRQGSAWTSYVTALLGPIITWTSTQTLGHQWIVI